MNLVNLFVVFIDAAQDLNEAPLSFLFKQNAQAEYYQIEAEGLQLSPSFGQVSSTLPPLFNLCPPQTSFSNCIIFIIQSPHETLQLILFSLCLCQKRPEKRH